MKGTHISHCHRSLWDIDYSEDGYSGAIVFILIMGFLITVIYFIKKDIQKEKV